MRISSPSFKFFATFFNLSLIFLFSSPFLHAGTLFVPEPLLERALAKTLRVDRDSLTSELVAEKLEYFELNNAGIRDLTGLQAARNLKVLVLRDNLIKDLSPIAELAHLRRLDLSGNKISNLSPLSGLSQKQLRIKILDIQEKLSSLKNPENEGADLILSLSETVEKAKRGPWQLRELSLANNRLLGLSGISHLNYLQHLDVSGNALIDLEGVGTLDSLVTLYAQSNQLGRVESFVDQNRNNVHDPGEPIEDESGNGKLDTDPLTEIQSLAKLVNLYLYDNMLKSVASLSDLPRLQILLLSGNQLEEVNNLSEFKQLRRLSLSDNRINSLAGLDSLPNIEHLYLVENRICDLRPIQSLRTLKELRLQRNQFVSIKSLSAFSEINVLSLSNNFIYELKPLLELRKLKRLSLTGNCLELTNPVIAETLNRIRSKGAFVVTGNQKKRIIEAEQLVFSMIGHPESNRMLGNYLEKNGYLRLMDFVDEPAIEEGEKINALKTWKNALIDGTLKNDQFFSNE